MNFDLSPTLNGSLLILRPLKESDFEELYIAAQDPLIWENHPNSDRYKRDVFQKFFLEAITSKGALVIYDKVTQKIIGTSRYYELDESKSEVVIGYTFLARNYWGGNFNRELKKLMIDHARKFVLNIYFHVDQRNLRSQKAMSKIGGVLLRSEEKESTPNQKRTVLIYKAPNL